MTITSTTDLASLLSAKRVAIEAPPEPEVIDPEVIPATPEVNGTHTTTVTEHGEIVPAPPVAVVEYEPHYPTIPPKVLGGLPYVRDYKRLALTICNTEMVPKVLRGRPDAILAMFLKGYEMGFGPMQALASFEVIEGVVGIKPEAMRALIMDNGHQFILGDIYDAQNELTAIEVECHRKDWPDDKWTTYRFSLADARKMELLGKSNWKKMPRAMLDARASAGAGRRYFADVLAGMSYTPEEIRDFSSSDQEVTPSTAPTPAVTAPVAPPSTPPPSPDESPTTMTPPPATSAPESDGSTAPPQGTDTRSGSTPPSEPSESEPAKPKRTKAPKPAEGAVDSDVRLEMRKALTAVIGGLEPLQQPLCRAYLAQQGYGDVTKITPEQIQQAIDIAAGWPDTATLEPPEDEVVDAEVVEDGRHRDPL